MREASRVESIRVLDASQQRIQARGQLYALRPSGAEGAQFQICAFAQSHAIDGIFAGGTKNRMTYRRKRVVGRPVHHAVLAHVFTRFSKIVPARLVLAPKTQEARVFANGVRVAAVAARKHERYSARRPSIARASVTSSA